MKKAFFPGVIFICLLAAVMLLAQGKQPPKDDRPRESKSSQGSKNIPDGYGSLKWGALTSASKGGVAGKIIYTDEKKVIVSRDGDIEYLYGFFYVDPAVAQPAKDAKNDGRLFYVAVSFPYLALDDVKKKIEAKYGAASGEAIKKNQGALLWDSDKTTIILWVDEYEGKPYCRKITYVGKEIAREINEYQQKVFTTGELKILEGLNP
jgi:hypothetical protein